jgi:hypothetical protein
MHTRAVTEIAGAERLFWHPQVYIPALPALLDDRNRAPEHRRTLASEWSNQYCAVEVKHASGA